METKEQIIEELLKNAPADTEIIVDLPSEGRAYNRDGDDPITIRPMRFEDEKSILSSPNANPLDIILERCVKNIKIQDLLLMDKHYLILKLREISYGNEYGCLLICPKCGAENQTNVLLSELPINPVPDDFKDPKKIMLPVIKKEVEIRYPRVRDEKYAKGGDWTESLWRYIVSIDGYTDKSLISEVVKKLPLVDMKTIVSELNTPYGVETKAKLECNSCGGVSVVGLPIGANFFGVS